jgi:uncharacterized protein
MLRRTPCIGTCSTTYGDLICRGCKRFAHEVVQWNAYDADQRRTVWQRLLELRAGAVAAVLEIRDEARLREQVGRAGLVVDPAGLDATAAGGADADVHAAENLLYELLQRLQWREPRPSLESMGVALAAGVEIHLEPVPETLLSLIDSEFYLRSVAQYERNYRIPAE